MKRVKSLAAATLLTFIFTVAAAAQEPTCHPGETHTPPCSSAPVTLNDFDSSGEAQTTAEGQGDGVVSLVELAFDILLLV